MFLVLAPTPAVILGALCVLMALVTTFTAGWVTATRLEAPFSAMPMTPFETTPPGSRASNSLELRQFHYEIYPNFAYSTSRLSKADRNP